MEPVDAFVQYVNIESCCPRSQVVVSGCVVGLRGILVGLRLSRAARGVCVTSTFVVFVRAPLLAEPLEAILSVGPVAF